MRISIFAAFSSSNLYGSESCGRSAACATVFCFTERKISQACTYLRPLISVSAARKSACWLSSARWSRLK